MLIYRRVTTSDNIASYFENRFEENGWGGTWRNGIFDYHHFHSNAHEALGIAQGKARIQLGGDKGRIVDVVAGDILILPAGTGHKNVASSPGFLVVGAYPKGQEKYDICKSMKEDARVMERITAVSLPEMDPLLGSEGALLQYWR